MMPPVSLPLNRNVSRTPAPPGLVLNGSIKTTAKASLPIARTSTTRNVLTCTIP